MTTIGRSAAPAAWAGDSVVLGAMIVALVPMGVLHLVGSSATDPITAPVGDHVAVPGGYSLIGVSAVALAAAGLVLAAGRGASHLPHARTVGGVLVGWSTALTVVARSAATASVAAAAHAPVRLDARSGCGESA
ncbi:hypothetical protein ACVGOW_23115 [Pseudonocardia saturnea]